MNYEDLPEENLDNQSLITVMFSSFLLMKRFFERREFKRHIKIEDLILTTMNRVRIRRSY